MELITLGLTGLETKALPPLRPFSQSSGWWGVVRESFTGAWQQNVTVNNDTALTYSAVFACITLIAGDIGKLCMRLVQQDDNGIWTEQENSAFSPVLRRPNRYQHFGKFAESWIVSKLIQGNAYILKEYNDRQTVRALYVLDPTRVTPLVAMDGSVWYQVRRDDLSGMPEEQLTVPASRIIHDTMVPLFHPLVGVTPLFACGLAAMQGIAIQSNSTKFFQNGSLAPGILTAPGSISDETARRLKAYWETNYTGDTTGKIAILGDGLKFERMAVNAVDAQLIEQLDMTGEQVCTAYHVPPFMVGIGDPPPYANFEPLVQQYYSQCLQSLITNFERCLDDGLGLGKDFQNPYGTEFDISDLIWMDTEARTKAASDGIGGGGLAPNEARKRYYGLGPVTGGENPYLQQQNYSLAALAARDANDPFAKPEPAPPMVALPPTDQTPPDEGAAFLSALHTKAIEEGLYVA
jgi:HK97 family phage portal protein